VNEISVADIPTPLLEVYLAIFHGFQDNHNLTYLHNFVQIALVKPTSKPALRCEFCAGLHMGLGRWLRNTFFWGDSAAKRHLHGIGIRHPDDMSAFVVGAFFDMILLATAKM